MYHENTSTPGGNNFGGQFGYASLKMGYIYALKEDYHEAMKWTDHYIALAASPGLKALGRYWKSFYHYWLGNLEQSIVDLQMIKDIAEAIDNKLWKAQIQWMNGWIHYEKGEYEISQNCFNTWHKLIIENDPSNTPFYTAFYNLCVGLVDLKWGRIDSANSKLDKINAMLLKTKPPDKDQITFVYDLFYGELLLKEGNFDKIIAICEEASLSGKTPLLLYRRYHLHKILINVPFLKDVKARAYQKKRLLDKAIEEYERLITLDPKSGERRLIYPKYYYRLAKLYEQQGNTAKAIEHYEKFLDLWKDADPGIAEVEDAKKRLAGLK